MEVVEVVEVVVLEVVEVVVELLVVEVDTIVVVELAVVATAMVATGAAFDALPQADTSTNPVHATARDRRRMAPVCQRRLVMRQRPHRLLAGAYARGDADAVITGAGEGDASRQ